MDEVGLDLVPVFKICPSCKRTWETRDRFIADRTLCLTGYEADFERLEEGLFYFSHTPRSCGSTLVIRAEKFLDLYQGPRFPERTTPTGECPRYYVDRQQLSRSHAQCECAFVREVLRILSQRGMAVRCRPSKPA